MGKLRWAPSYGYYPPYFYGLHATGDRSFNGAIGEDREESHANDVVDGGSPVMPKTRVLLADDHAVVAQGLEALLKDDFDLVGIVHDGRALIEAAETLRPDVIVTDISMPLLNGLDAIRQVRT